MGYNETEWAAKAEARCEPGPREFGFRASVPFEEGLKKTIEWYISTQSSKPTK